MTKKERYDLVKHLDSNYDLANFKNYINYAGIYHYDYNNGVATGSHKTAKCFSSSVGYGNTMYYYNANIFTVGTSTRYHLTHTEKASMQKSDINFC